MVTIDDIGEMVDTMDNLVAATNIPMPAQFHLEQIVPKLKEFSEKLKYFYSVTTGENPWE